MFYYEFIIFISKLKNLYLLLCLYIFVYVSLGREDGWRCDRNT